MADLKISALTASTTPLAGTEVLPIVQSSTTKQVSVANLTAGRAVSVASVAITGGSSAPGVISKDATTGLQIRGIAGSGYDLEITNSGGATAQTIATGTYKTKFWDDVSTVGNVVISTSGKGIDFSATPGTGTSELFSDYEEGTFTPLWEASGGGLTPTYSEQLGRYTKIGRMVYIQVRIVTTGSAGGTGFLRLGNMPFTSANVTSNPGFIVPTFSYNWPGAAVLSVTGDQNSTSFTCYSAYAGTTNTLVGATALAGATVYFIAGGCYEAA